jgi:hypothetical protein
VTTMLSPDLLDRRALALLRLVDVYGRPVEGPVRVEGDGVRLIAKGDGHIAVLAAAGLEAHAAAFETPPGTPALRSRHILLDLTLAGGVASPRRFDLRLPRDPNPANAGNQHSLFRAVEVEMPASPRTALFGSACSVRVTVRRADDERLVENALVRLESEDGTFAARALTDARGEANLIVPELPIAFTGGGANLQAELPARVVVHVAEDSGRFHSPEDVAAAAREAAGRTIGHADPDTIATAFPADFAAGAEVSLAAGRQVSLPLEWAEP